MKPFLPILSALLAPIPGIIASEPAGPPIEVTADLLDRLVTEATGHNPSLQAAEARTEAANEAVSAIRTWDDPKASFGVWAAGPGGFGASEQGNLVYGLEQKLPLHGRPELQRKAAESEAAREQLAADVETRQLRRDLATGLLDLALADREADLAREDFAWLDATASAVDRRYRVGKSSQTEWLKAQTLRAIAADAVITKGEEREHGAFAVNRLLNRELHTAWPRVAIPSLQPSVSYTEALVESALEAEPELRVMRQESVSAQAAAELTRRSRLPEVSVGLQAWQYSGDGTVKQAMATVDFSVPWLNRGKYDSDWRRDQARKRASDKAAEGYALSVREVLHHHVIDLDAARRQALLYRDQLIPLTEQTLASAQNAWEHGLGIFEDILEAHRMLVADQLGMARALTQQARLLADLCFLTGSRDTAALAAEAGSSDLHPSSP